MNRLLTYVILLLSLAVNSQVDLLEDTTAICEDVTYIDISKKVDKRARVQWFDPYMGLVEGTAKLIVIKKGKYTVKVTQGNNVIRDSTYVKVYAKPRLNLRDTILCKGQQLVLDARNPGLKFQWSTGETTQKIRIDNGGRYWVKVFNGGCMQSDTMNVKLVQGSVPNFGNEMTFCFSEENKTLSVKAAPGTRILWSTGTIYPSINASREGWYWVKTDNKSCGEQIDSVYVKLKACDCEMLIPNSFTPNDDNKNDHFYPVLQCDYSYFTMTIMDRWDNVVFYSNSTNGKWDGKFKGNLCPEGMYTYVIESIEKGSEKKNKPRMGQVSLFR